MSAGNEISRVDVVVLRVDDVEATKAFYRDVVGRPVKYETVDFAEIAFDNLSIAIEKWAPEAPADSSPRQAPFHFTVWVDHVDAMVQRLQSRGADLVMPPTDEPQWGLRTATFSDPSGTLWELAQEIASQEG